MEQLPAFLAATLGTAFLYQSVLILLYIVLINIRKSLWASLSK
jgi:hypothetical protein